MLRLDEKGDGCLGVVGGFSLFGGWSMVISRSIEQFKDVEKLGPLSWCDVLIDGSSSRMYLWIRHKRVPKRLARESEKEGRKGRRHALADMARARASARAKGKIRSYHRCVYVEHYIQLLTYL